MYEYCSRRGVCLPIFLRPVVDVTRLIPDARAVDMMMAIECKAVIQADMFSQRFSLVVANWNQFTDILA